MLVKKNMEFSDKYHHEIWTSYEEMEKKRMAYSMASKDADAAAKKYLNTSKNPKSGYLMMKSFVTGKDSAEQIQKVCVYLSFP